jgi:DNA-directed RNA polymerase subunit H (RpoH/RPB5)
MDEINAMVSESSNADENPLNILVKNDKTKKTMKVIYYITSRPTASNIEAMSHDYFQNVNMSERDDHTLIIIVKSSPNDTMVKMLKQLWDRYHEHVVVLDIPFLQMNILKHEYVPPHIKLTVEEKEEFYKKFNIVNDKQVPEIPYMDPVARVIFLKPGEVCRIIRYDKISFKNEYYRICVS